MIKLLRVDDRLIHGQVATTWTKTLQADSIIVANDEVIHNELQIIALKLAVPAGMKVAIRSVEDAIGLLQNPKARSMKIFVVVNHPRDAAHRAGGSGNCGGNQHRELLRKQTAADRGKNQTRPQYLSQSGRRRNIEENLRPAG